MISKSKVGLLVVALFVGAGPVSAQTTLKYKFNKGEKLSYVMDQKMAMKMNVGGMDIQMNIDQTIEMSQTVNDVDADGNAKLAMRFDRFRISMDTPMGKIEVDTAKDAPADNPVAQAIAPIMQTMKSKDFLLTMTPQGEQKDLTIPPELMKVLKANPVPGMQDMFSEDTMKRTMTQSLQVLAKTPVKKGQTWENKLEMKMPFGMMKTNQKNQYEGPEGSFEKISTKTDMSIEPDANSPFQIKMKVDEAKGTVLFDAKAGRVAEMTSMQVVNMDIAAMGQNISQRIEATMKVKLK